MRINMKSIVGLVMLAVLTTGALTMCPESCVCKDSVVNCSNKDIQEVPVNFPQDTIEIDLSSNKITFIKDESFKNLPSLTKLDLSDNLLKTMSATPFREMPALEKLKLDKNPFICYCSIKWIAKYVRSNITFPSPICHSPPVRKGKSIIILTSLCDQSNSIISNEAIEKAVSEAKNEVEAAVENTLQDMNRVKRSAKIPREFMKFIRFPIDDDVPISVAAEIFEHAIMKLQKEINSGVNFNITTDKQIKYDEVLSVEQLNLVSLLSGCTEHRKVVDSCTNECFNKKYRTINGACNNLEKSKSMYGASSTPLARLLPPQYENNFNLPRGWSRDKLYNGFKLPSPRKVSIEFISSDKDGPSSTNTLMFMQWGQILIHDMSKTPTAISNAKFSDGRFCNETCVSESPCFPIPVDNDDPRITSETCIGFVRSTSMCGTGLTSSVFGKTEIRREQMNANTAFVDASMVYGSTEKVASELREMNPDEGLLEKGVKSKYNSKKHLLPTNGPIFFKAGDSRVNEQVALTTLHVLLFREHNRLAKKLKSMNPEWDGNQIYHETRKIVGGIVQHITYKTFLHRVIGDSGMQKLGEYTGYKSFVNPNILNSFTTAAFRFGHTYVRAKITRLGADFKTIKEGPLELNKAFVAPQLLFDNGGIDPIVRGLFKQPSKESVNGDFMTNELTEKLFKFQNRIAKDLASFNLQRGRDHGLPSYNSYRQLCNLRKADKFDDISREMSSKQARRKLEKLYGHPDNVDLFAGGLAEDNVKGGVVGETFACIIAAQFKILRDGDRFWYENPGVFTENQLREIKKSSLARVICDNSDGIMEVQKDVFGLTKNKCEFISCSSKEIPIFKISQWASD